MPPILVTSTIEPAAGFANETVVNSFVVTDAGPGDAAAYAELVVPNIMEFFTTVRSGMVRAIGTYLSATLSRAAGTHVYKAYALSGHLDGSPHGSPVFEATTNLPAAASVENAPPQTTVVLTLRGRGAVTSSVELGDGSRPRTRATGRLHIGSLNVTGLDRPASGVTRPSAEFRQDLLLAAEGLQDSLNAEGSTWAIWSRKDTVLRAITSAEVDDSLDVLRSRKMQPTVRDKRVFAPVPSIALGA